VPITLKAMVRVRDLVTLGVQSPGPQNAITDIAGVRVGNVSLVRNALRTGVTAVLPHPRNLYREKVTAACAVLNGYGKSVGLMQIEELGSVETPILITSTLNVPRVSDALITYMLSQDDSIGVRETVNPVVLECFDGYLNDARARAVGEREVVEAIATASDGPVAEGCVGAGVGMRCQGFKSGVGTSSRRAGDTTFTVGVLVVPNFGFPGDLMIAGVPVGRMVETVGQPSERGSCIFVLATDAPLAAGDLRRLAWRCFLGMARTGAISGQTSGDLAIAFSTTPRQERADRTVMNALFRAAVESSEEAILNALFTAETTTGRDAHTMPALSLPEVVMILRRHGVPVRGVGQES